MMRCAALFLTALLLVGCAGQATPPPGPVRVVVRKTEPLPVAAECDPATDPAWTPLPENTDVSRGAAARINRANKNAFAALIAKRRVCWAPHVKRGAGS